MTTLQGRALVPRFSCFGALAVALFSACSGSDQVTLQPQTPLEPTTVETADAEPATNDSPVVDDEVTSRVSDDDAETQRWIVGGWLTTVDDYTGYLTVVDNLTSSGTVDISKVVEFGGDMVYASPGGGVVLVGLGDSPNIERWGLNADGELYKQDEVSLTQYGVTNTLGGGRNVMQFIDDNRAYYFDRENLQVIVFNPTTMTTEGSFSIAGLGEEGQEVALNFIHQDGDRFIITARYWDLVEGTTTPLVRAAVVDSADDSVEYFNDTRCGDIAFQVTDAAGNLYLGSHPGHAVYMAAGLDGDDSPPQCILRIRQGENRFDPDYFVNLTQLSGGVVGGLLQGADGHAYVFEYEGDGITAENWRPSLRGDDWALKSLVLSDAEATYASVEGLEGFTAYGNSFSTVVDNVRTPFVVGVEADFSAGTYFNAKDPVAFVQALSFPGFPGHAIALD